MTGCFHCPTLSRTDGLLVPGPDGSVREDGAVSGSAGPFVSPAPASGNLELRGSVGEGGAPGALPSAPAVGWAYEAASAGTYGGVSCAEGDVLYCASSSPVRWAALRAGDVSGAVPISDAQIDGLFA